MNKLACGLAFCAGQAIAQPVPLNQRMTVNTALCATEEAAIEVASTIADKGVAAGTALFESKQNCAVVMAEFSLKRLVAFFRTPEGLLKVVEARIGEGTVYILTYADLKGMIEVRLERSTPQPT